MQPNIRVMLFDEDGERKIGGKGGGGSVLTDEAKEFLYRYEQYRDACKQAGKQLYPQFFPDET